ncbi:MAG: hypothetical protein JW739_04980 [Opitutales bacterium]|nr:hypothetical protein [Opitutales bacterium]
MKVTAFHLINKIEEASKSYFSNSMLFSGQKIGTRRVVDFHNEQVGLDFFVNRAPKGENVDMGSLAIETVQERDNKVAFQCRMEVLPSGDTESFFILLPSDREAYAEYMGFINRFKAYWEKQADKYLPPVDPNAIQDDSSSMSAFADDEYEGLTPEEIEAVTGVRPGASSKPASDDVMSDDELAALTGTGMPQESEPEPMSMDDLESLIAGSQDNAQESPTEDEAHELSEDDIASLLGDVSAPAAVEPEAETPAEEPEPLPQKTAEKAEESAGEEVEMSAEDIWKQISGGKPLGD